MAPRTSRRADICRAAVALAARGGSHALTHQGIDAALGIARGSTSYYYRTRSALIGAVAEHVATESAAAFADLLADARPADGPVAADPGEVIERYLEELVTTRRDEVRARIALLLDADCTAEHRRALAGCLFSRDAAVELFRAQGHPRPERAAAAMLDGLEGRVLRSTVFE